jgi:Ca2+-binding RTX toxin-like protein
VIADFSASDGDRIAFMRAGFGLPQASTFGLGVSFVAGFGVVPTEKVATFEYDLATGRVMFDADGTGSSLAVTLAVVQGHPDIGAKQFMLF